MTRFPKCALCTANKLVGNSAHSAAFVRGYTNGFTTRIPDTCTKHEVDMAALILREEKATKVAAFFLRLEQKQVG
jgi:hypothetical protein